MEEQVKLQGVPVKVYRSEDRLMVAAPMPGLEPEDITVEVTAYDHLIISGEMRGLLKDIKELLVDEWSVGNYYRELILPEAVDGEHANVTYGNGVLVIALPLSQRSRPAHLTLEKVAPARGERVGHSGHE
jgi:HSP20 family protein